MFAHNLFFYYIVRIPNHTAMKKPFLSLIFLLLLGSSCSKEEVGSAIDHMMTPLVDSREPGTPIPENAILFVNDLRMPEAAKLSDYPADIIHSITVNRATQENPQGEVRVQLKEGYSSGVRTTERIRRLSGRPLQEGETLGTTIVRIASERTGMLDYDFYLNGERVSVSDLQNCPTQDMLSISVKPNEARVDITIKE